MVGILVLEPGQTIFRTVLTKGRCLLLDGDDRGRTDVVRSRAGDVQRRVEQVARQVAGDGQLIHLVDRNVHVADRSQAEVAAEAGGDLRRVDVDGCHVVRSGRADIDDRVDDAADVGIERHGGLIDGLVRNVPVDRADARKVDGRGHGRRSDEGNHSGRKSNEFLHVYFLFCGVPNKCSMPSRCIPRHMVCGETCSNGVYKRQCGISMWRRISFVHSMELGYPIRYPKIVKGYS